MKVVALAGGTGSAKILRGLAQLGVELTVIGNVGDNFHLHGLYVCPDLDIAMYTLAGIEDPGKGWGIDGDTFAVLDQLSKLGIETWFRLGDKDIATQILRRQLLEGGMSLTRATDWLRRSFGVDHLILPVTDDPLETYVTTPGGSLHLQEFWVREKGRPRVVGVEFRGSASARPTEQALTALEQAERIVICPANPVTSVGPMTAIQGFTQALSKTPARVAALSPMLGTAPFSGPAAKLMKAVGMRTTSVGVAEKYSPFLDSLIVDAADAAMKEGIKEAGVDCVISKTLIRGSRDEVRLARELLAA